MIKNWSRTILALIVLPIIITVAAVISTSPYLVVAVLFPLMLIAILLNYSGRPKVTFLLLNEEINVVYVGDIVSFRAQVIIENGTGLYFLRLPALDSFELLEDDTNVHIIFKSLTKVEKREYVYRMKALRRGVFKFPDISYTFYPLLGLSKGEEGTSSPDMVIKVLPKINLLKRSQVNLRSFYEMPRSSRARLGPHSTDFLSIREYAMGDPYKFINWKASSRNPSQDKLLVNEYEREGMRTILFILDRSEIMRLGTAEENPLEYGIGFVLSYSRILLNQGMNVGVWLEPPGERESSSQRYVSYVIPSSGIDHYERIKELLISVEPRSASLKSQLFEPEKFGARHRLLQRIVRESVPMIVLVTNLEKSNKTTTAQFSRELLRAGAGSITILDISPYNIISKYAYSGIGIDLENRNEEVGLFMKSILVKTKKKDQYVALPRKNVRVVDWDPTSEPVGRAIKHSMIISKRDSGTRR
jgi:uncharacterized protein (DUF58 family)